MDDFCNIYNLWSLNELRTCYNNPNKITCIDLMLTNSPESFYNSYAIETSLSDFRKMTIAIMKTIFVSKNQK